jgi:GTP-binding protein
LALFDEKLSQKPMVVAINKLDLPQVKTRWETLETQFHERGYEVLPISALAREGLRQLLFKALEALQEAEPLDAAVEDLPVYHSEPDPTEFEITREKDGGWRVTGVAIERAAQMTYWEYDEAVRRFQRLLEHMGVESALRNAGAQSGDTVRIGEFELEWMD